MDSSWLPLVVGALPQTRCGGRPREVCADLSNAPGARAYPVSWRTSARQNGTFAAGATAVVGIADGAGSGLRRLGIDGKCYAGSDFQILPTTPFKRSSAVWMGSPQSTFTALCFCLSAITAAWISRTTSPVRSADSDSGN